MDYEYYQEEPIKKSTIFNIQFTRKNFILLAIIVLVIITAILVLTIAKINSIDVLEEQIVYVKDEKEVNVKVNKTGNFIPVVIFSGEENNYKIENVVQMGEDVKTTIIGKTPGEEKLIIKAKKQGSTKEKVKEINVIVCDNIKLINTGDNTLNIYKNDTIKLQFNINEKCLSNYKFMIENDNVATINEEIGEITGKSIGTTKLIVHRGDKEDIYTIKVVDQSTKVKTITIKNPTMTIEQGNSKIIELTIEPINANDRKLVYSSSNEQIAKVDSSGKIKAIGLGTVIIKVSSEEDPKIYSYAYVTIVEKKESEPVITKIPVRQIFVSQNTYKIKQGDTTKVTVGFNPSNATNQNIICKSLNANIASVTTKTNTCTIKAGNVGTTTVEIYSKDGNKKQSLTITVYQPAKVVNIKVGTWNIGRGSKHGKLAASKFGGKIKEVGLDIIGLQEAKRIDGSTTAWVNSIRAAAGMNYYKYVSTPAGNAIISNYVLTGMTETKLAACKESRKLQKAVILVNGVNISVYNTHLSYQSGCPAIQMATVSSVVNQDPNPVILLGDFNVGSRCDIIMSRLTSDAKLFARDALRNSCTDPIIVIGKGKLTLIQEQTYETTTVYTDHNMVTATIAITN